MKYSTIGYILGQVLKFEGIFMLLPFLTGMIYHENEAYSYLIIGIICFVLGCLITLKKVKHPQIFNREGFRQQISTTCEGHCKNSVSYLFGHYDH